MTSATAGATLSITIKGATHRNNSGHTCTSSSHIANGKHEWLYGRFEMRGKIPVDTGSWPAWWAVGTGANGSWPKCSEIGHDGILQKHAPCERLLPERERRSGVGF